jgi:LmbE family N-acetylglucosaminyl deacetylase
MTPPDTSDSTHAQHVETFGAQTDAIRAAMQPLLDECERVFDLIDDVEQRVTQCDRTIAKLRRNDADDVQGPLNSVSAVEQHHRSLRHHLTEFHGHVARFFDLSREMRPLHTSVLGALQPPVVEPVDGADTVQTAPPEHAG